MFIHLALFYIHYGTGHVHMPSLDVYTLQSLIDECENMTFQ